ncbi:MAG: hypothetical protein JSS66_16095 [Armatimonadetes bacterium]|nr:hypothetical protein [Armatimonadota bacterium]
MNSIMRLTSAAFLALGFGTAFAQTPVVDGTKDASYTQLAVQNNQTGWGDSNLGQVGPANGSELDNIWYYQDANNIYLFIGGNMQNEPGVYQKVALFCDSGVGGYNRLPAGLPDIDFNRLIRMADDGTGNGLKFDAGFNAGQFVGVVCGGNSEIYINYSQIETVANGGVGYYVGSGSCGSNGAIGGGTNNFNLECTINNSNVAGVPGGIGSDPGNGASVTTGIEIKIPRAQIANSGGSVKICPFIFSDGYDFVSNQFLNGLGGMDNLGDPRNIDLSGVAGDQYVTIPAFASSETLAPATQHVTLGQITSGNVASLGADDNNAERMCRFILPNRTSPFIVTELTYTTTKTTLSAVAMRVKAKMTLVGQFAIKLGLKDQTQANVYDTVLPETSIGTSYTTFTGNASGSLAKYRGTGGAMAGQISVRNTGPVPGSGNWCTDFEFALLDVIGN